MKSKSAKRVLSILIIFALSVATASPAIAVEPNNSHSIGLSCNIDRTTQNTSNHLNIFPNRNILDIAADSQRIHMFANVQCEINTGRTSLCQ